MFRTARYALKIPPTVLDCTISNTFCPFALPVTLAYFMVRIYFCISNELCPYKMKERVKSLLFKCSFKVGILFLVLCACCYLISFVQFVFPISGMLKGILWTVFFGLAKTFQYCGLLIVGIDGIKRIKQFLRLRKA